jgi:hypothetical protein
MRAPDITSGSLTENCPLKSVSPATRVLLSLLWRKTKATSNSFHT